MKDTTKPKTWEDLAGWFTFPRLYTALAKAIPEDGIFVEVGVYQGKSLAYFLAECHKLGKRPQIYAVDHFKGEDNEHFADVTSGKLDLRKQFEENMQACGFRENVDYSVIVSDSDTAADVFKDAFIDAGFIDACHEFDNVMADVLAWEPKVKRDGFLGGHDFQAESVRCALDEALPSARFAGEMCWKDSARTLI